MVYDVLPAHLDCLWGKGLLMTGRMKKCKKRLKVVDGGEDTPVVVSRLYRIANTKDMGESGSYYSKGGNGGEHVSKGDPYPFSPYQAKDNILPATKETNALILTYY